jgi:hypothetical protein
MSSYPKILYLHHSGVEIHLKSSSGPQTTFKIFGSPYVPTVAAHEIWAFGYDRNHGVSAHHLWSEIPLDTDVVLTHTPAYNHRDASSKTGRAAGCEALRKALWKIRPRLAVCGHVHEARGAERVKWRLGLPFSPFLEEETIQWTDPGARSNRKMSLVNVTRQGGNSLLNTGVVGSRPYDHHHHNNEVFFSSDKREEEVMSLDTFEDDEAGLPTEVLTLLSVSSDMTAEKHLPLHWKRNTSTIATQPGRDTKPHISLSRLHHHHISAQHGRSGRLETLFVNASVMAKRYGHGSRERINKPIVVDIELPVGT